MNIKDYLHFYIGQFGELKRKAEGSINEIFENGRWELSGELYHEIMCFDHEFILELRPLSDVNNEEAKYIMDNYSFRGIDMPRDKRLFGIEIAKRLSEQMGVASYLLSKGFDLFGLQEKGLAIYKTDVK